jgi:hypothetical protein
LNGDFWAAGGGLNATYFVTLRSGNGCFAAGQTTKKQKTMVCPTGGVIVPSELAEEWLRHRDWPK